MTDTVSQLGSVAAGDGPPPTAANPAWRLALPGAAVGLVSALVGLGRLPLWLDESLSLGATNQLGETLRGTGGTMAGYYLVLTPWAAVSEQVWWVRLPSVAFALATLLPLAALARRVGGDVLAGRTTLMAGGAMAFTRYAQEARAYALVMLLVTTLMWAAVRAVEEGPGPDRRWWRACVGLGITLVLCHGLSILAVLTVAVILALAPEGRRLLAAFAPTVILAMLTVAWLWTLGADEVGAWVSGPDAEQVLDLARTFASPTWWAAVPLLGLVVAGAVVAFRDATVANTARWQARVPVLWLVLPVVGLAVISIVRPSLLARYVIFVVPPIALLLARATVTLDERVTRRPARLLGPGLVMVALLLVPGQLDVHQRSGDDWRAAAEVVADRAEPGDALLFPQTYHRTPFEAGWQEVAGPAPAPQPIDTSRPLGTVRRHDWPRPPEEVEAALLVAERVWVVTAREPGQLVELTEALASDPVVRRRFRIDLRVELDGSVEVALLVAR